MQLDSSWPIMMGHFRYSLLWVVIVRRSSYFLSTCAITVFLLLLYPFAMAEHYVSVYGTEKDKLNCPFYVKIGACRHGDRCSRIHNKPVFSQTILLHNLYQSPEQFCNAALAHGFPAPNIPEDDRLHFFEDFYYDILDEMNKYGVVDSIYVCENLSDHLSGNTYVKFIDEDAASNALKAVRGRWYAGRIVRAEFSPVTDFREGKCRPFERDGTCERGNYCHFMHLYKTPVLKSPVTSPRHVAPDLSLSKSTHSRYGTEHEMDDAKEDVDNVRSSSHGHSRTRERKRDYDRDEQDYSRERKRMREQNRYRDRDRDRGRDRNHDRLRDPDRDRERYHSRDRDWEHDRARDRGYRRDRDYEIDRDRHRDYSRHHDRDRTRSRDHYRDRDSERNGNDEEFRDRGSKMSGSRNRGTSMSESELDSHRELGSDPRDKSLLGESTGGSERDRSKKRAAGNDYIEERNSKRPSPDNDRNDYASEHRPRLHRGNSNYVSSRRRERSRSWDRLDSDRPSRERERRSSYRSRDRVADWYGGNNRVRKSSRERRLS